MFKIKGTKSQGCCYCDKCKLVNRIISSQSLKKDGLSEYVINFIEKLN